MQPEIVVNYLAVLACVVGAMPVGFLWFGPVFGKAWARHMGFENMEPPGGAAMVKSMGLYLLGSLLIAFVLAHSIEVWRPSTWSVGEDQPDWVYALNGAGWTWLGFFLPLQMGRVAWEFKRWGLVAINASFDLTRLLLFGFILAYRR
jgi:hypothetical protein